MRCDSVLDAIGGTPLVRLARLSPPGRTLWLKFEALNPGGSAKDRAVRSMLLAWEAEGRIAPGATVVEGTAGNTGIGLAMCAASRGYKAVVVLPRTTSPDKVAVLRLLGAELVFTEPGLDLDHPGSYAQVARRIAEERGGLRLGQFDNPANPRAHVETTGPELWRDLEGRVDVLIACCGTGGTLAGTGRYLRGLNPSLRVVAAQPAHESSRIEGITDELPPDEFEPGEVQGCVKVPDEEAIALARRAAREEGLLIGSSAGVALAAALRDAVNWPEGAQAVVIASDTARNALPLLCPA